jgi:hypothetical protein
MKNALALVALASCAATPCQAASPAPVPENLQACSKLTDVAERVRCYDTEIAKMNAAAAPARAAPTAPVAAAATPAPATPSAKAATATAAATAPVAAPQSAAAKFGEETLPISAHPKARPPEETTLLSSITALRTLSQEKYAISLANGQIWRQEEASQVSLFFRVGDSVRIEKGALGSYHMSTDKTGVKNWVRVTRVQ